MVHEPPTPAFRPPVVLFEGAGLVAIEKPPMIRTNGRFARHNSMEAWARRARNGELASIVHRLDTQVGGVLICATSRKSFKQLKQDFENRNVKKQYIARVIGEIAVGEERTATAHLRIATDHGGGALHPRTFIDSDGVPAKTHVRCLAPVGDGTSLVECFPESGRHHQIRAHLQHLGWPIANDAAYGGQQPWLQNGPEAYVDNVEGTLAAAFELLNSWCVPGPEGAELSQIMQGRALKLRLAPGIWLFSFRYELSLVGVSVQAPLPTWAAALGS